MPIHKTPIDLPPGYDSLKDCIELVPYQPEWSEMAQLDMQKLKAVLPSQHIIDIQHVGSTAIGNILSKPIIDLQIAVDSLENIKALAVSILSTLDYVFWEDNPDPERMFFVKGMPPFGEKRSHHVHIVEATSKHWKNKILFRDYLKNHPAVAKEYEALKVKLRDLYKYDREAYTKAKTDFVNSVLEKATGITCT